MSATLLTGTSGSSGGAVGSRALGRSASAAATGFRGGAGGASFGAATLTLGRRDGVSMDSLVSFVFPPSIANPDSVGRLEVYANYGPADERGQLRGGPCGARAHTDLEIAQMASENCREALYAAFAPKPRSSVEAIVEMLHKVAMSQRYTEQEVRALLSKVEANDQGRLNFTQVQDAILAAQRQRLNSLIKRAEGGKPVAPPKEKPPRVLFQSKSAATLMTVTRKAKTNAQEEQLRDTKLLNSYACLTAPLEHQQQALNLRANVMLVRGPGNVSDRWDRYCALRRAGRGSYVNAKNWDYHGEHPALDIRFNPASDDGLANKYPGAQSLLAASAGLSSAAAQLSS